MKYKTLFLLLILLTITYFTLLNNEIITKPFLYFKDLLFYPSHAKAKDINLSNSFYDSIINSLIEDIDNLKKINNINLSISEFDVVNSTVIERNKEYWFNTLTINKGKIDGIEVDMAVVDSNGLIGRISMVTKNTSVVKLITTNDTKSKISAVILNKNEKIYGVINGYDSNNNLLFLTITSNIKIEENSKVETTGMGGVFPSGILIGNVYDVIKKDDGVTNVVRVKPTSNIEGDRYVSILLRQKDSNN